MIRKVLPKEYINFAKARPENLDAPESQLESQLESQSDLSQDSSQTPDEKPQRVIAGITEDACKEGKFFEAQSAHAGIMDKLREIGSLLNGLQ